MSKVELGSISTNNSVSEEFNYIGSVIESTSGYITPKLITNSDLVETFYGKFPYYQQYKSFVDRGLPVCLLPLVTHVSKYNLPSIRFSSGAVPISYPKIGKWYDQVILGNVITKYFDISTVTKVVDGDVTTYSLEIQHDLDYYPLITVALDEGNGSYTQVNPQTRYSEHKIELVFQYTKVTNPGNDFKGFVTIESFPDLDKEIISIEHYDPRLSDHYELHTDYFILPEIVVTSEDEDTLGDMLYTSIEVKKENDPTKIHLGKYRVSVRCTTDEYSQIRLDVRKIPLSYTRSQLSRKYTSITYESSYYPIFKIEDDEGDVKSLAHASVDYVSYNEAVITTDKSGYVIRWNLVTTESDFNFKSLLNNESVMNTILDFSDVKLNDLKLLSDIDNEVYSNYVVIKNEVRDVLIATSYSTNLSSSYFNNDSQVIITEFELTDIPGIDQEFCDVLVTYEITTSNDYLQVYRSDSNSVKQELIDKGYQIDMDNTAQLIYQYINKLTKSELLANLKSRYNNLFINSCYDLKDIVVEFLNNYDDSENLTVNQYNEQPFLEDWKVNFLNAIYAYDFWLADNQTVADIFNKILAKYDGKDYKIDDTKTLIPELDELPLGYSDMLNNSRLLFVSTLPVTNVKLTNFVGLDIDTSSNLTYDKLCEYSESNKIVEFYSKIRGESGTNVTINIEPVNFYPGAYYLDVSNGLLHESYTIRLYELEDDHFESIFIDDIGLYSELVTAKIYNYLIYYNGKMRLIDSRDFNDYESPELYNQDYEPVSGLNGYLRSRSELVLPTGEFQLNRTIHEVVTYDDRLATLDIFKQSDYYPDLFLVDQLPDRPSYAKAILDLVNWNESEDGSVFSQALIKLNGYHLCSNQKLFDNDNRVLYFYEDTKIGSVLFPSYYETVYNIMQQNYLHQSVDYQLYNPFEFEEGNYILLREVGTGSNVTRSYKIVEISDDYIKVLYRNIKVDTDVLTDSTYSTVTETYYEFIMNSDHTNFIELTQLHKINPIQEDDYLNNMRLQVNSSPTHVSESLKDYLYENRINYYEYDGLKYKLTDLKEPLGQPTVFPVQYVLSKVTRELYKISGEFLGNRVTNIYKKLNDMCTRCRRNLSLMQSISYELSLNDTKNTVTITFTIEVTKIVNKIFKINYILNV